MRIGQLAAEVGLTTKTIRYYESIGLLADPPRTPAGYRMYDHLTVDRLCFVRQAQASGLSLAEIRSILEIKGEGGQSCAHTRALLDQHLADLDRQIISLQIARDDLALLATRAADLDTAACTDPNRCQVISERTIR